MLVSRAIPALYGGVSQQPDAQRSEIQLRSMVNAWATVVDGLGKRPPTEHIAELTNDPASDAYLHLINRDLSNRYVVVITQGDLQVFSLTGVKQTVNFPHGKAYLQTLDGRPSNEAFSCVSVADYTFVVNKDVRVSQGILDSDRSPAPIDFYSVNKQPNAAGASQVQYAPNPSIGTFKGAVQTLQDLPETPNEGDTYQIRSTADSGFASYYVRRTQGTWIECTKPGVNNTINALSMPWALVRRADGTWDFAPFSWAPRRAGDEVTNPGPSFLGRTLNSVFFANNRLGFLCGENQILSRAGDFGNFWRMTVVDLLDDDVVDIAATETKVTDLMHALPMAGDVMLFSEQTQFRFDTGQVLTPTSGSLKPVTHYPMATTVAPEALGSDVYFGSEEGGWVRLLEYFVDEETNSNDASDVTAHVPRFIPKGLRSIAASADHDAVFLATTGAPNRIYHYKFYWSDPQTKAQSAWGYWEFQDGDQVLSLDCLGDRLYVVISRADGLFLESITLSPTAVAPGLPFEIYLDRRLKLTGEYNAGQNRTHFVLPFSVPAAQRASWRVVKGAFSVGKGALVDPNGYQWADSKTLTVPGNVTAAPCFLGIGYRQSWQFSRWFMRTQQNTADLSGRLQIRTVSLYYTRAAYFATEVAPYGVEAEVQEVVPSKLAEFTGKTVGKADLILGDPVFDDGVYSFQVYGSAEDAVITISNDSHLGAWFTSAEVEFFWQKRSRFG